MKLEDLKPESDLERHMCGTVIAQLRQISLAVANPQQHLTNGKIQWKAMPSNLTFTENGIRGSIVITPSYLYRIISQNAKVDPSFWKLFPDINYLAKDKDGSWYGYRGKPKIKYDDQWDANSEFNIDLAFSLNIKNDDLIGWRYSLIKRPFYEEHDLC